MDRTIVLPYEPTTSPILPKIPGTAAGGLSQRRTNLDSCIYISVPKLAITGFGEIDLICTTTHHEYLLLCARDLQTCKYCNSYRRAKVAMMRFWRYLLSLYLPPNTCPPPRSPALPFAPGHRKSEHVYRSRLACLLACSAKFVSCLVHSTLQA